MIFSNSPSRQINLGRSVVLGLAAITTWSCAPLASVDETSPELPASVTAPTTSPELKKARDLAESATALEESDPKEAIIESEEAAKLSLDALGSEPGAKNDQATAIYNYSVGRLVEATLRSGEKPWEHEVDLSGPNGPIELTMKDQSKGCWVPDSDQLISTDRLEIGGKYFTDCARIEGVGLPLISKGQGRSEPWSPDNHYFGVTALADISGSHCAIDVVDPDQTPVDSLAGEKRTVAADFSAPMALSITETNPQKFGILALLRSDRFMDAEKMIMVEPYRPNRQPVILIHGLIDSPVSWTPMINALNGNSEIRRKYQIWTYRYPSGLPFPLSAELLRQEIAAIYQKYPGTPKAILVGHSMGGLLSHLLMCDSGDQFCIDALGKPLADFNIEPDEMKTIQGALYFKKSPYVAETIFMATPHRGADLASNPFGRLGASLIRLPVKMVTLGPKIVANMNQTNGEDVIDRFPNSIDTLRPQAPVIKALNNLKISPSIPYYSVIGDRGRGDTPKSSDGVVAYESSHLDGAKSELIVPSDHLVQQNPEGIAEVQRILLLPGAN